MKILKKLLKARVFIWLGVTIVMVGVLIAANIIAGQEYAGIIDGALGGNRPIVDENDSGIPFEQDFETKEQAFDNGNAVRADAVIKSDFFHFLDIADSVNIEMVKRHSSVVIRFKYGKCRT